MLHSLRRYANFTTDANSCAYLQCRRSAHYLEIILLHTLCIIVSLRSRVCMFVLTMNWPSVHQSDTGGGERGSISPMKEMSLATGTFSLSGVSQEYSQTCLHQLLTEFHTTMSLSQCVYACHEALESYQTLPDCQPVSDQISISAVIMGKASKTEN